MRTPCISLAQSVVYLCLQRWNGSWFEKTSLKELGLIVQLGHPPGEHCANPEPSTTSSFIILDDHGVHDVSLNYCGCGSAELHSIQLLRYQLFPATVTRPKSAATFRLLEHYHLLSFEAKTSMFAYYYTLARETDNTGISPPKVRDLHGIVRYPLTVFVFRIATPRSSAWSGSGAT